MLGGGWRTQEQAASRLQYYDERHGERTIARPVPKLRFTGRWLEHAGFRVGDPLQVTVGHGVLPVSRRKRDP